MNLIEDDQCLVLLISGEIFAVFGDEHTGSGVIGVEVESSL